MPLPHRGPYARHPRFWLCLLALILAIGTFFIPPLNFQRAYYRYMFVFDITQSMNVSDAGPVEAPITRLDFAKQSVVHALRTFPCGSEAGLGIFTQNRTLFMFTPVEVCEHYDEIFKTISDIEWRMAWRARSEVSKGLYSAVKSMRQIEEPAHLVFITDGHEAPPAHAGLRIRFAGDPGAVKGIVVGVGGGKLVPIPKFDISGDLIGYWQADEVLQIDEFTLGRSGSVENEVMAGVDRSNLAQRIAAGTEHLSSLKEAHLRELADEVGHRYHRLNSPQALGEFLTDAEFGYPRDKAQDIRWILAVAALISLLLSYLPHRRNPGTGPQAALSE
ncbi:MAG: VWA domain-containing protein [Gammaproteobacteria bacterium]|nr:VWA domain-containing protein [Gammaproteobacteria bacterium]